MTPKGNGISAKPHGRWGTAAERIGLTLLIVLLSLVPFHENVMHVFIYYKEVITILFLILNLEYILRCGLKKMRIEAALLFIFPALLVLWALLDSGNQLYDESKIDFPENTKNIPASLVILRNAILYIPMVFYFSMRGIKRAELHKIVRNCVVIAPISLFVFLLSKNVSLESLGISTGTGLSYLNYVPYLTFAAMCGMYLISRKASLSSKVLALPVILLIVLFAIISTGRQNIIYLVICTIMFLSFSKELSLRKATLILGAALIAGTVCAVIYLKNFEVSEKLVSRLTSIGGFLMQPIASRIAIMVI
jgi:hypothetical protein